ncbi:TKL protein kinase [Saprolegnia parasitica CBS 223.65]|uniref:TKL protein kinase n=1 Tax=Saprolegnia parasitica (strain CBS 223.65) TaxID=695850 RepID=A0A067C0T4_SAPPC|nr:TKL protein kinase [Saprolegnia parasitica CBS 223.65]KDO20161.1 TKL protein kinase [Saprolegnia parasitica CBS 223.65]|eukprot:XP_012209110.1 TKL protein kinase [Saprolegnia parasitica CBS 223.65]
MSKVAPAEQQLPKLHVAIAMARALADLHAAGLFHGSLSSHGVFRSTERVVKVGVPGTSDPNLSTLPWTAPERLGMFAPCTPEADIYALGVILTELDTLRAPFAEERWNDAQLMTAVGLHHCRPRLTGDCAPWYAALVNECLHPDPTKRPTAATIVATLNDKMAANWDDASDAPRTDAGRHLQIQTEHCVSPLIMAIKLGSTRVVDALHQHTVVSAIEVTAPRDVASLQELGRGLRSSVYKAQISGVDVAIKTCHESWPRTCPITALLSNPSPYLVQIVAVAGRDMATPQLVLEYMDGGNLRSYLDRKRLLERTAVHVTAVEVAYVVANALKVLHKQGIAHGGVKSANVLLSSTRYIKLDVTLASERTAAETQMIDTMPWLAPEILRADGPVDGLAADMYAFGVLLAELDTSQLPYGDQPALTPPDFTQGVVDGTLRPRLSTACEPWYRELTNACLRDDPKDRLTADDLVSLLYPRLATRGADWTETYLKAGNKLRLQAALNASSTNGLAPWAMAALAGQVPLARILHAAQTTATDTIVEQDLPELNVPAERDGRLVVHRRIHAHTDLAALASFTSPFVVAIEATAAPHHVLVECLPAKSLRCFLDAHPQGNKLPPVLSKFKIASIVANAMVDVHAHGLVHGHLSSHNVVLSSANYVQISAPGLAATEDALRAPTAPEVLSGDSPPSCASDVYALGVLLTELDNVELGLDDEAAAATKAVVGGSPRDDCDDEYRNLVASCLDNNPEKRPTATDVVIVCEQRVV